MNLCKTLTMVLAGLGGLSFLTDLSSAEPEPAKGSLTVLTASGKEVKLKTWKFVAGTRRLSWLAPAGDAPKKDKVEKKGPARRTETGPEALVFREEHSTTFKDGIVTYILLEHIRAINYDTDNQSVTVRVAAGDKDDATIELKGTTKYKEINKLTIEAEADLGDLGVAEVKFQGGITKGGIRGVVFPSPKAAPAVAGTPAQVTANEKGAEKAAHKAVGLLPFYRLADGTLKTQPFLMFKKALKLDVGKIARLVLVDDKDLEFQVTLKDGKEVTLTLVRTVEIDGQNASLEGLLGRVPAGYKLFPMHTVSEIQFDETKE